MPQDKSALGKSYWWGDGLGEFFEDFLPLADEHEEGETLGLVVVLQQVLAPVPRFQRGYFDWQCLFEQALREQDIGLPVLLSEVDCDLLQQVVERVQTEHNEQFQGVVEDAVLVYLEDIF